jgi:hypothetical protein
LTPTRTAIPTHSPTFTWTPTYTHTPTFTPTVTFSPTQTGTPTNTGTPTMTPTPGDLLWVSRNSYRPAYDFPPVVIHIRAANAGAYVLKIYNSAGELVRTLRDDRVDAPISEAITWDAKNQKGEPVASGVYLIYFTSRYGAREAKLLVIR